MAHDNYIYSRTPRSVSHNMYREQACHHHHFNGQCPPLSGQISSVFQSEYMPQLTVYTANVLLIFVWRTSYLPSSQVGLLWVTDACSTVSVCARDCVELVRVSATDAGLLSDSHLTPTRPKDLSVRGPPNSVRLIIIVIHMSACRNDFK